MKHKIVDTARSWLGTPFCLHARVRSVGCDCLGLVIGVANELNLTDKFAQPVVKLDYTHYGLLNDGRILSAKLSKHFTLSSAIEVGNLALFTFDNNPSHLGIIGDYPHKRYSIIHANAVIGKVVEHRLSGILKHNLIATYELAS